ncbi:MAG: hypothetical protein JWM68_3393 [Verrucomicrobiales bacterium]|nr:hypothetical protein [Verrucomicrobiales bacterium]
MLALLMSMGFTVSTFAQDVSIPDPGLNAAIRDALQKPVGQLTQQDMLELTTLSAQGRNVKSIEGLKTARNLSLLNLRLNHLTNFALPAELTNLTVLDVSLNGMTTCSFPNGLSNLVALSLEGNALTNVTLPIGFKKLNSLDLNNNQITSFSMPSNFTSLLELDLGFNLLTNYSLPAGLTNLDAFLIAGNPLTNLTLPAGLTALTVLNASQNQLTKLTLPAGMTNLIGLHLFFNQLTNLSLPNDLRNLDVLDLDFNRFTNLNLPSNLTRLGSLKARDNLLTSFNLPTDVRALTFLDIGENRLTNVHLPTGLNRLEFLRLSGNTNLTSLILPVGMTNLIGLFLRFNGLTNLTLPPDLSHLIQIDVLGNKLMDLTVPAGLTNLATLIVSGNQLTNLTLPPDMTQLTTLVMDGNPIAELILSETLAANFTDLIGIMRTQGIVVYTYPVEAQLIRVRQPIGAFQFSVTGPPGVYSVLTSADLATWSDLLVLTNRVGSLVLTDGTAHLVSRKFYRTRRQSSPTNMVFIPPNSFKMGSPTNELDRSTNEGPQTTVTLSRGFWIGKYEVTQGEYVSIMNTNPSFFPGDLNRAVSSVSWFDATNYCAKLTQRDLAAGRIPTGSKYRLPTEAEWECAARAGTSTRFSYGDDPVYVGLPDYAWGASSGSPTVHPVGQKLPNAWGLYDMAGNVWEWCQDWFGTLPGGVQTNPTGPASSPGGWKVMRGGAYDYPDSFCRSATRSFFPAGPFNIDSDLGFRVVLVTGP